ncbi:MAG: hypothetical protein DRJ29_18460, partial [Bacteroidetes bacterium]
MILRFYSYILLIMIFLSGCTDKEGATYVEGLLYEDGEPVRIEIVDGIITQIEKFRSSADKPEVYLAPGLIDIQVNGYMGVDFSDQELTREQMLEATRALWKEGVTSYYPTVITRDQERLEKSFSLLAETLNDELMGMSIPGFHLEGPYLSPVQGYRGAHPEEHIRLPDWEEFTALQEAAKGGIRLITVAPEMEGAIPFIEKCRDSGVVVSLGHHNGTADIIDQAVKAGASL